MTEIIKNLDLLISENIASAGERGRNALQDMRAHLNKTITSYTPQIIDSINKAGKFNLKKAFCFFFLYHVFTLGEGLQKASNNIKTSLHKASKAISTNTNKYTELTDDFLAEYSPYRFYLGICVCSVLLLVVTNNLFSFTILNIIIFIIRY